MPERSIRTLIAAARTRVTADRIRGVETPAEIAALADAEEGEVKFAEAPE